MPILKFLKKNVNICFSGSVLDVGCGRGHITKEIAEVAEVTNVVGIDPN